MLDHPTLNHLHALKLDGMTEASPSCSGKTMPPSSAMPNGWAF